MHTSRSFIILGLMFLHGLTDVVVGVYGTHDLDRAVIDLLTGALSRSQLCLLAMWLIAGSERLSWRICGLLTGSCMVFVVFSRATFSGQNNIGTESFWREEEWAYYFRLTGPGDLLIKLPILIGSVAGTLFLWRVGHRTRCAGTVRLAKSSGSHQLQFSLRDVAVWVVTICVVLVTVFQTAPYAGWFPELSNQWLQYYRMQEPTAIYAVTSTIVYVIVALASLWMVYGKPPLRFRAPVSAGFILGTAYGIESWLHRMKGQIEFEAISEFLISVAAATVTVATLLLFKLYMDQPRWVNSSE